MASSKPHKKTLTKRFPSKKNTPPMASFRSPRFSCRSICLALPIVVVAFVLILLSISSSVWRIQSKLSNPSPQIYSIEVVNEFPHDPKAFTQGLVYAENDTLFESTGLYGESSVRKVHLRTGKVETLRKMQNSYFGEGLTLLGERLYQVVWLKKTGFVYDRYHLSKVKTYTHQMKDGWGLATDGTILFGTDGTSTLYQIDPQTFKVTAQQIVKYNGREVRYLNELEYVNGEVWANVWQTDCIARISYEDGIVLGWILLQNLREGLIKDRYQDFDVLNGIAWDNKDQRLFVTGKLWPKLYEIKLHPIGKRFTDGQIEQLCMI